MHGSVCEQMQGSVCVQMYGSTSLQMHGSTSLQMHGSVCVQMHGSVCVKMYGSVCLRVHGSTSIQMYYYWIYICHNHWHSDVFSTSHGFLHVRHIFHETICSNPLRHAHGMKDVIRAPSKTLVPHTRTCFLVHMPQSMLEASLAILKPFLCSRGAVLASVLLPHADPF